MILTTFYSQFMSFSYNLFSLSGELVKRLHEHYFTTTPINRQNILTACLTSFSLVNRPKEKRRVDSDNSVLPNALMTDEPLILPSNEQALPTDASTPSRSSLSNTNSDIIPGTETLTILGKWLNIESVSVPGIMSE